MRINQAGIDLIKRFESCRLTVYKDLVGLSTVGYGHRTDLPAGSHITQQEAEALFVGDISRFCQALQPLIKIPLNDNQFSALVSLAYNIGVGNFRNSTLLRLINLDEPQVACREFIKWDRAGGVEVPGLLRRRLAEQELFNS